MYAVRKLEHGPGHVGCVEVPEPQVEPGKVKIKIAYCGVCGSDTHLVGGYEPPTAPLPIPFTLGHEFSGTVSEVGEGVTSLKVGDRVTANVTTGFCGKCQNCLTGAISACSESKNLGYETDGAMAEYICMEEGCVFKLPDSISLEEAALTEPCCVAAHAVLELTDLKPSDTVVVMGSGPIGLLVLQFVKACGARTVLTVSKASSRMELGKKLGAEYAFAGDQCNVVQEVRKITGGKGADYVFECSGTDASIAQAIMMTRKRGTIVELAITNPNGSTIKPFLLAVMQEMRIQCSYGHSLATWPKVLRMMEDGKIDTKSIITHQFSFQQCDQAFACRDSNKLKILLHP